MIELPKPEDIKKKPLFETINKRYSCRSFKQKGLNLREVSLLLWSAGGKKVNGLSRTIPSAGKTYPLEFYLVVGKNSIEGLEEGIYHYKFEDHTLELVIKGDKRENLAKACLGQDFISQAPISLVITAIYSRTTWHYGERGERYVHMEAGNSTQNIHLMAENLDLGTVVIGAFYDEHVKRVLNLEENCQPLAIMPIGYPKDWEE